MFFLSRPEKARDHDHGTPHCSDSDSSIHDRAAVSGLVIDDGQLSKRQSQTGGNNGAEKFCRKNEFEEVAAAA